MRERVSVLSSQHGLDLPGIKFNFLLIAYYLKKVLCLGHHASEKFAV